MGTVFITNDPSVKHCRLMNHALGQEVSFKHGICNTAEYGEQAEAVADWLLSRKSWPIYGLHFHRRDAAECPIADEPPVIRQGAIGTGSLKGKR